MGMMSGCYDLDQFPHDRLSSGTFWKTLERFFLSGFEKYFLIAHLYGLSD